MGVGGHILLGIDYEVKSLATRRLTRPIYFITGATTRLHLDRAHGSDGIFGWRPTPQSCC